VHSTPPDYYRVSSKEYAIHLNLTIELEVLIVESLILPYLLTYGLTNSTEKSSSPEANRFTTGQLIS
jgi:hypothetical protein